VQVSRNTEVIAFFAVWTSSCHHRGAADSSFVLLSDGAGVLGRYGGTFYISLWFWNNKQGGFYWQK
jgi:hypothetical protein